MQESVCEILLCIGFTCQLNRRSFVIDQAALAGDELVLVFVIFECSHATMRPRSSLDCELLCGYPPYNGDFADIIF